MRQESSMMSLENRLFGAILNGSHAASGRWWLYPLIVVIAGPVYGAVLGSWGAGGPGRLALIPYAAIKAPLLVIGTTMVCLPGYFVLSTVLGLRADFPKALGAIGAGQAGLALALASLAPLTRVAYVSGIGHAQALLFAAGMFLLATSAGTAVMMRRYRPLFARSRKHVLMLGFWVMSYVFVGIQMGWMLRPFVGSPGVPVTFVRQEPWTNAYVALTKIVAQSVQEFEHGRR